MSTNDLLAEAVRGMTADRFVGWMGALHAAGAQSVGQVEVPARSGRLAHQFLLPTGEHIYIRQDSSGQFRLWQPPISGR